MFTPEQIHQQARYSVSCRISAVFLPVDAQLESAAEGDAEAEIPAVTTLYPSFRLMPPGEKNGRLDGDIQMTQNLRLVSLYSPLGRSPLPQKTQRRRRPSDRPAWARNLRKGRRWRGVRDRVGGR